MRHMKKMLIIGGAAALFLITASANATQIKSSYSVDANTSDPGLVIHTAGVASNPFSYNLDVGDSVTFDLFDIWTDENSLDFGFFSGCGDDCDPKPIQANFSFSLPESNMIAVNGDTQGDGIYAFVGLLDQHGELNWGGPESFLYGPNDDGKIRLALSDETFNEGAFGLNSGRGAGATVEATLTLVSGASPVGVPGPGTLGLALLGFVLCGLGFAAKRRGGLAGRC